MMINQKDIDLIKSIVNYRGRKVYVKDYMPGMSLNSYWSGGCRDYFFFVNLKTGAASSVPQNGTMFDRLDLKSPEKLEADQVLVMKTVFRGKNGGLWIYA